MSRIRLILILAACTLAAPLSFAQLQGGPFTISKSTMDNGGGVSGGDQFILTGTIGQFDASAQSSVGGVFRVTGGFWPDGQRGTVGEVIFADGFENP